MKCEEKFVQKINQDESNNEYEKSQQDERTGNRNGGRWDWKILAQSGTFAFISQNVSN